MATPYYYLVASYAGCLVVIGCGLFVLAMGKIRLKGDRWITGISARLIGLGFIAFGVLFPILVHWLILDDGDGGY
jgi:multisubunit Na+/H+ antiporter MnhB subunit